MSELRYVKTEEEAISLCKEFGVSIVFRKAIKDKQDASVEASLNAWTKTIGRDLTEAINRLVDLWKTPPMNHDKIDWYWEVRVFIMTSNWDESEKTADDKCFYDTGKKREVVKLQRL